MTHNPTTMPNGVKFYMGAPFPGETPISFGSQTSQSTSAGTSTSQTSTKVAKNHNAVSAWWWWEW